MVLTDRILVQSINLLSKLESCNIRFAHWKGSNHLLDSLNGITDIELLIHPHDRDIFESAIKVLGFKKVKNRNRNTYPYLEDWIGFDEHAGKLIHVHTHFALILTFNYGRYLCIPWTDIFFNHLITDKVTGWPIPVPELESIILFVRIWAKGKYNDGRKSINEVIRSKQPELIDLLKKTDPSILELISEHLKIRLPNNISLRIDKIINQGSLSEIESLGEYFFNQIPFDSNKKPLLALISQYSRYLLQVERKLIRFAGPRILKKTVINGGKVIAFVGSDGSGKSTLSKDIIDWLTFKIDTHYFYMGKSPFIKSYNKLLYSKAGLLYKRNIVSFILKRLFKKAYYISLIHHKLMMLNSARKLSTKGSIIICDRFPQKDIPGVNDGPKLSQFKTSWLTELEMKLFEKINTKGADIIIRLKVSPEVASVRKPEHDPAMIKTKCDNINKIKFNNSIVIDVDANKPYEEVLMASKREIWKLL